ncbi:MULTISPECIES: hypothetical protein [unclassified Microbacterium]|uniref:hypothetical protein n=1 Tax=unclassified Microbacterium TaxID=2609290 RepID=UPI000CFC758E|nr:MULTISPECIES: hypothetical protein [unclassified Microbacterium]PQZ60675.1 hypothetical protein CQ032_04005 [Microbacterium sp. MYb43]PQZ82101.1 hypothetical protein CQ031_01405 [Microbacterium sp. MYb40]PRB22969.1 hypothetical protein CQ037_18200 [Microbacterium sp. MYb50]PRB24199.1 hypothetical protein CQ040_02825 [Microbacterium sp. MYb54]PRB69683.1 hypothetical protein CQ021_02830 [Microbacterium sp. MYb24]
MTEKHRDPEYLKNARTVRARVRMCWRNGTEVRCWRTGAIIEPGMSFDVGHIEHDGGHGISNLAPESVKSNRSEGGRRGAAITNGRTPRTLPSVRRASREGLAPW